MRTLMVMMQGVYAYVGDDCDDGECNDADVDCDDDDDVYVCVAMVMVK